MYLVYWGEKLQMKNVSGKYFCYFAARTVMIPRYAGPDYL